MRIKLKHCDGPCQSDKIIWANKDGKRYCQECYRKVKQAEPTSTTKSSRSLARISPQSDKRKKEDIAYSAMRKVFLEQNKFCKMKIAGLCTTTATDVQHLFGRGKHYLDTTTWMSACRACHSYADTHPTEAIENGWAMPRVPN